MSVPLPAFRRIRLTQQCVIHPQDKGGNYLPCASEDWVLFVSLAADGEKIILRTDHRCLPIEPGGALLLPPNVCHELPFVQAPCLMLEFSAADDGQAMFEFPQLQGTPAWMLLLLLYSEQTTAESKTEPQTAVPSRPRSTNAIWFRNSYGRQDPTAWESLRAACCKTPLSLPPAAATAPTPSPAVY